MSKHTAITIFIPTYNGEKYIEDILKAIFSQEIDKKFEVLIIDSGSTDRTLEIINKFPEVRLHEIPNHEFGHGKTRQLAANMAEGEIIVYLSHDAVPAHDGWLYEITKPLTMYDNVAGVMGKQIPRHNCPPIMKYEINAVFRNFGPDYGTTLFYKDDFIKDQSVYDAVRFYSDVNSATRRKILLDKIPYRDVAYAEDQMFGEDIIETGMVKAYSPRGSVYHSNDVSLKNYNKRIFDETFGLRAAGVSIGMPSMGHLVYNTFKSIIKDSVKILIDRDYSVKRKVYWLFLNPFYHIQKWRGFSQALNTDINDKSLANKSLEHDARASK